MSTRGSAKAFVAGRYLLDTHAFLYLAQYPGRLPARLKTLIADGRNAVCVSIASLWEIQVKASIGKLEIGGSLAGVVAIQQRENGLTVLPIAIAHVVEHGALPLHHRDPFDRMLIAQARVEGLTVLSHDAAFAQYDVVVRW
ncbi:MAG: type II toxin-antitoxin system VapC family toxin [Burkholderiaceae bacterium]